MGHGKFDEDRLVVTEDTWHGRHDVLLLKGTTVPDGCAISRIGEIVWATKPLYIEVSPGRFVPFGDKKGLVREPNAFSQNAHVLDSRGAVKDYVVINNDFLIQMATELAERTGWQFEGCGTLQHNEVSFVQLRINTTIDVGGREYERHVIRLFYADNKRIGSGFGGLQMTRVQCMNTFRAAVSEDNIIKIEHVDDPEARWKLLNAHFARAIAAIEEQKLMLDSFFVTPITNTEFKEFVELTFPLPQPSKAMIEAKSARALISVGDIASQDFSKIFEREKRAIQVYRNERALAGRRREATQKAFEYHNRHFRESASTFYAAMQGLTYPPNHGNVYRGTPLAGILFGGQRGKDIKRGYKTLVSLWENS